MQAYVSAPRTADLRTLSLVLEELGISQFSPATSVKSTSPLLDPEIEVDAAIVVLEEFSRRTFTQYVEAGISLGLKLPLLLLADKNAALGPLNGLEIVEFRSGLQNHDALRFHVGLFFEGLEAAPRAELPSREHRIGSTDLQGLRARLEEIRRRSPSARGQFFEEFVGELFKTSGADIARAHDASARGFDLVAAIPGEGLAHGAVLLQVKSTARPPELLRTALELQDVVVNERAALGVLLFDDSEKPENFAIQTVPMVVILGVQELLAELESQSLNEILARARDDAIHTL